MKTATSNLRGFLLMGLAAFACACALFISPASAFADELIAAGGPGYSSAAEMFEAMGL
jgi:hypothetical protein